jgi:malonyl-CoA O-methyltransferase
LDSQHLLKLADVRRRFDRAADGFDDADFVHGVTREGLFARLEPVVIDASVVVDLGCATGSATRALAKRFRGASIVAIDLSRRMLERCQESKGWFSRTRVLQADAAALPFADQSVDVVFANMLLPWVNEPTQIAAEVSRVLRKDGLFFFATLGPDSLLELRSAWARVDGDTHINHFLDMHDVGDVLVQAGLRDPVLDVDRLAITYSNADDLFRDLTAAGARNSLQNRHQTVTGKRRFGAMREHLEGDAADGRISLDLELVYGHCWGSGPRVSGGDVRIDASAIPIRGR